MLKLFHPLTTISAFEGAFPGVSPGMSYHVGVVSEGLATVVTFEGLVARVCPHMFLQGPGSTELLSAQLAPEQGGYSGLGMVVRASLREMVV